MIHEHLGTETVDCLPMIGMRHSSHKEVCRQFDCSRTVTGQTFRLVGLTPFSAALHKEMSALYNSQNYFEVMSKLFGFYSQLAFWDLVCVGLKHALSCKGTFLNASLQQGTLIISGLLCKPRAGMLLRSLVKEKRLHLLTNISDTISD